jgi:hypothetical protein
MASAGAGHEAPSIEERSRTMSIKMRLNKGRVPVKIFTDQIEPETIQQLLNVSQLLIVFGPMLRRCPTCIRA